MKGRRIHKYLSVILTATLIFANVGLIALVGKQSQILTQVVSIEDELVPGGVAIIEGINGISSMANQGEWFVRYMIIVGVLASVKIVKYSVRKGRR
ncbi:MAG: hypothetical protein ACRCTE_04510 [Cellulosilyticaceae bacterium]